MLTEIKQPPYNLLDPSSENVLNPIHNASASSITSKEVNSPVTIQSKPVDLLPKPELESEPLLSPREDVKDTSNVKLSNLNEKNEVEETPLSRLINSNDDDSDSSEDEGIQDYKVGGYHPVHVGEIYNNRYI